MDTIFHFLNHISTDSEHPLNTSLTSAGENSLRHLFADEATPHFLKALSGSLKWSELASEAGMHENSLTLRLMVILSFFSMSDSQLAFHANDSRSLGDFLLTSKRLKPVTREDVMAARMALTPTSHSIIRRYAAKNNRLFSTAPGVTFDLSVLPFGVTLPHAAVLELLCPQIELMQSQRIGRKNIIHALSSCGFVMNEAVFSTTMSRLKRKRNQRMPEDRQRTQPTCTDAQVPPAPLPPPQYQRFDPNNPVSL